MGKLDRSVGEFPDMPVMSRRMYLRYLKRYTANGRRKFGRYRIDAALKYLIEKVGTGVKGIFGFPVTYDPGRHKPYKWKSD